ncbi:hypothetical protein [Streptomyces tirandamycinicus]|uniref:Uncharacterized protein n=1 Tax=Streptomyces tirandamycinicus TaxID=2174846 RepID=A0A2S1T252_9ACTN|nr:hypothetical protein [Streptomyces tirandamycinicus]AWI32666.1 hypothetical protein DDW44_30580 [Streptomyces tirandamycinicus]
MLGRRDSAVAAQLDRCLSGDAEPAGPEISGMVMAAAALRPRRPISESARQRAFDAMMREADRQARGAHADAAHTEDLTDPGVHARVAQAGPGMRLSVADIESIDDERLEDIAARLAARLGQSAPDRNQ